MRLCQRSTSARCVCAHQCGSAGHKHTNKQNGNPSSARIINMEHFCAQVRELPVRTEQNRVSSSPPEGDIHPGMRLTSSPPCHERHDPSEISSHYLITLTTYKSDTQYLRKCERNFQAGLTMLSSFFKFFFLFFIFLFFLTSRGRCGLSGFTARPPRRFWDFL